MIRRPKYDEQLINKKIHAFLSSWQLSYKYILWKYKNKRKTKF